MRVFKISAFLFVALLLLKLSNIASADNFSTETTTIIIPDQIAGLTVGKANYSEVIAFLGRPELTENVVSKLTGEELLELKYPMQGIEFTIDKNKQMRVTRIEVHRPFRGRSKEGLVIGMPFKVARTLLVAKYGEPRVEVKGYVDWEAPNTFAIKHESGVVVAFKMLGG